MDCYITNGKRYITLDEKGSVQTCEKDKAKRFPEDKAKNILDNLPKQLQKFHFKVKLIPEIPAPNVVQEKQIRNIDQIELKNIMKELDDGYLDYQDGDRYNHYTYKGKTKLEDLNMDGITNVPEFLKCIIENLSEIKTYINNMNYYINECDLRILDIRHYLRNKNTKLGTVNASRMLYLLQGYERQRAKYKMNRNCAMLFSQHIDRIQDSKYVVAIDKIVESEYKYRRLQKKWLDDYAHGKCGLNE